MSFYVTVDVEDWFQVENLRPLFPHEIWDQQEYRIERNTERLLELFNQHQCKATFFVLGCLAERFPKLIQQIEEHGHEIASHGDTHIMLTELTTAEIQKEVHESKLKIEQTIGKEVIGFRAPVFSATDSLFKLLADSGYKYDSSIFPFSKHDRYSNLDLNGFKKESETVYIHPSGIHEFVLPLNTIANKSIPWAGGGYFRLIPYGFYRQGVNQILDQNQDFIFYMHPWEIDHKQPRVKGISSFNRFRHYYGLNHTYRKLDKLLSHFPSQPLSNLLNNPLKKTA